jgi:hypothetical protein
MKQPSGCPKTRHGLRPKLSWRLQAVTRHAWHNLKMTVVGRLAIAPAEVPHPVFLIPHHNGAEFLRASLHAIRTHHPNCRVLVADATSAWDQYAAASEVCQCYQAEMRPRLFPRGHTALLNYLMRQADTDIGIFLDQDCVLLHPLTPLFQRLEQGKWLIGPRDQMWLTHPNLARLYPKAHNQPMRLGPDFIHSSLMVTSPRQIRRWLGNRPFCLPRQWRGPHIEKYYGLSQRLRLLAPESLLFLNSAHSGYGLGMVYLHLSTPLAFHNWYSGRVFGQDGKIDGLEVGWLRSEMDRFLSDFWSGALNLDLIADTL